MTYLIDYTCQFNYEQNTLTDMSVHQELWTNNNCNISGYLAEQLYLHQKRV